MDLQSARPAAANGGPATSEYRCREQRTLACIGLTAALRRLGRRKRLRARALAALADSLGHE